MKINGTEITATKFAFDGCHKFYLLNGYSEQKEAEEMGYSIYPIKDLPEAFWNSCPLRFIGNWDLSGNIVNQFEEAVEFDSVADNGKVYNLDFARNEKNEN